MYSLRSATTSENDEIEEGSMEEYHLAKCAEILHDDLIMNVLDTTLRISVGEKYYKITEFGTFCGDIEDRKKVNQYALDYEKYKNLFTLQSEGIYSYDGVLLRPVEKGTIEDGLIEDVSSFLRSSGDIATDKVIQYNLSQYNVSLKNWWICGFDHSREKEFDSSHRVKFNIYNLNFWFYTSSGILVKLQKKKSILFITYWVEDKAEDRVIGFNSFEGIMTFNPPLPPPVPYVSPRSVAAPIADGTVKFLLGNVISLPVYKDFSSQLQSWVVEQFVNNTRMDKAQVDKLYNAAYNQAVGELRRTGKGLLTDLLMKTQPDPLSVVENMSWDGKTIKHILFGEKSYGSGETKSINFNLSFGVSIKYGSSFSISGYTPTKYDIKDADVYGAVKYKGQWKGIRLK